tara:strand:+ start:314 stop:532 length:219 start_codon:yes stop_codon:yes gene_type:complete
MSKVEKILDKILKKVNQVEKLHDKESMLCEEVKDLVEEVREQQGESIEDDIDDSDLDDEDLDDEDIDEEEEK